MLSLITGWMKYKVPQWSSTCVNTAFILSCLKRQCCLWKHPQGLPEIWWLITFIPSFITWLIGTQLWVQPVSQREIPPGLHGETNRLTGLWGGAALHWPYLHKVTLLIHKDLWHLMWCKYKLRASLTHLGKFTLCRSFAGCLHLPALYQKGYPTNHGQWSIFLQGKVSSSWNIWGGQKGLTSGNQIPCWTTRRLNKALLLSAFTVHRVQIPVQLKSVLRRFAEQNDPYKYKVTSLGDQHSTTSCNTSLSSMNRHEMTRLQYVAWLWYFMLQDVFIKTD